MRAMRFIRPAALALCAVLAACGSGDDDGLTAVCPPVVPPSLRVTVVEAGSGADLSAGASGMWASGGASGPLHAPAPGVELIAYGPSGRYTVTVQHAGYRPWSRGDVEVPAPVGCTLTAVHVRAELVPAS